MLTPLPLAKLAHMAGVLDTLAVITTRRAKDIDLPNVAINGPNVRLLEHLSTATGTKVVTTRRDYSRAGCAEHCAEKHQHIVSTSGRWVLTGARATVVLWNLRPFMLLQVEEATSAINVGLATRFKPATVEKMVELGWERPPFEEEWKWRTRGSNLRLA